MQIVSASAYVSLQHHHVESCNPWLIKRYHVVAKALLEWTFHQACDRFGPEYWIGHSDVIDAILPRGICIVIASRPGGTALAASGGSVRKCFRVLTSFTGWTCLQKLLS